MFVSHELAKRIESVDAIVNRDYASCYSSLYDDRRENAIEIGGGWASFAGLESPMTQAFGIGLNGAVTESDFDQLEEFYGSRGSAINIEVCPYVDSSMIELLRKRAYYPIEFSHVFIRDLNEAESSQSSTESDVTVREVNEEEEQIWSRTLAKGFAEGAEPPQSFVDIFSTYFRIPRVRCLTAEIDGRPVGGGLLSICDGVAALATTTTLPEFRGRGAQTKLLLERLKIGWKQGCDLAMVTTQPGTISHRNVGRQGFQTAYTRCKFGKR